MVEKEALIAAVFKRRPIWDPRHNKYRNRSVLQTMWNQIEKELGEDREILKSRWRGLRSYFGRELQKLNSSKGNTESARPAWPYFQQLLFLKEIWKYGEGTSNVKTPKTTKTMNENVAIPKSGTQIPEVSVIDVDEDDSDEDDYDQDDADDDEVNDINQSANKDEKQENFDNRKIDKDLLNNETLDTQKIFEELTIAVRSPQNTVVTAGDRKRNITDTAQENVPSKKMKENLDVCAASTSTSSPLPSATPNVDYDEDLLFLKSILPDLKVLPRVRKIHFKLKVQELLHEEFLQGYTEDGSQ